MEDNDVIMPTCSSKTWGMLTSTVVLAMLVSCGPSPQQQRSALAEQLGLDANVYATDVNFPASYFIAELTGAPIEEVHRRLAGYSRVFNCGGSELYYFYSEKDTNALRFELAYDEQWHATRWLQEDTNSRFLSPNDCIPGRIGLALDVTNVTGYYTLQTDSPILLTIKNISAQPILFAQGFNPQLSINNPRVLRDRWEALATATSDSSNASMRLNPGDGALVTVFSNVANPDQFKLPNVDNQVMIRIAVSGTTYPNDEPTTDILSGSIKLFLQW